MCEWPIRCLQPGVAGEAHAVKHVALRLAPREDRIAAKAAVAADDDFYLRQPFADGGDDFFQRLDGAVATVAIRRAELRPQTHIAAKTKQRQVAVSIVVAVEKAALLPAVERVLARPPASLVPSAASVIGRIEIEHEHLRIARQATHAER